ncbi:MAG: hypothetical protein ACE5OR_04315 [bacterium]
MVLSLDALLGWSLLFAKDHPQSAARPGRGIYRLINDHPKKCPARQKSKTEQAFTQGGEEQIDLGVSSRCA